MTISDFVREDHAGTSWDTYGYSKRRLYRERKRLEAQERQERFDAEVVRAARDHNISQSEARRLVVDRRRFEHWRNNRQAAA